MSRAVSRTSLLAQLEELGCEIDEAVTDGIYEGLVLNPKNARSVCLPDPEMQNDAECIDAYIACNLFYSLGLEVPKEFVDKSKETDQNA